MIEDEKAEVEKQKKENVKKDIQNLINDNLKNVFRGDPLGQVKDAWKNLNNLYGDTGADEYLKSKIGEENYNKFASGINSVEGFIDNPLKDMNKLNDYLENSEAGKYLKEHNKMLYDGLKMGVVRHESLANYVIDTGKGILSLHDLLSYDMDVRDESIKIQAEKALGINGMDDEETYKKALNANLKDIENAANMSWDAVKGMGTAIVEDGKTTLDPKKAFDWFTNPDMKLEDAAKWSQSAANTVMLVDGVRAGYGFVKGKFAKAGEVGAEAGVLEAPKTSDIVKDIDANLENNLKNIEKQDMDINDLDIKDIDTEINGKSIEESLDTQTEISNKNIKEEDFTRDADEVSNNIDKVDVNEEAKLDSSDVKVEDNSREVSKVEENATDINDKNIKSEDTTGSAKKAADDIDNVTKGETEAAVIGDVADTTKTTEVSKVDKEVEKDNINDNKGEAEASPLEKLKLLTERNSKITSNLLDDVSDKVAIIDRVKELRSQLIKRYKKSGNFAIADVDITGVDRKEFFSHNGIDELNDTLRDRVPNISLKPEKVFDYTTEITKDGRAVSRDIDSEYKILSDIHNRITNPDAAGSIRLFTEKEPCPSCLGVIEQFFEKHPNISIEIIHNSGVRLTTKGE